MFRKTIAVLSVLTIAVALVLTTMSVRLAQAQEVVCGTTTAADLLTSGGTDVGDIGIWNTSSRLYVSFTPTPPWKISRLAFHSGSTYSFIPKNPDGTFKYQSFAVQKTFRPPVATTTINRQLIWPAGTDLHLAARLVLVKLSATGSITESIVVWGKNKTYGPNMYFKHIVQSCATSIPTKTATATVTNTPTNTATSTATSTATNTPTDTPTNTPTDTPTSTPTNTPTSTATDTPTSTPTNTPTDTPTSTPTNTPTFTPTTPGETLGVEGCTPGYWKQDQHFDSWAGYAPTDLFSTVFGRTLPGGSTMTLLDALNLMGGGIEALARHAVAALLNATSPDVDYAYTSAQVISMFQLGFDGDPEPVKDAFDAANNGIGGCPLN